MKARWMLEATGASLLLIGPLFYPLIFPGDLTLYHHHLNFASLVGGLLLDMLGVFILSVALLAFLSRLSGSTRQIAGVLLASFLVWYFLHTADSLYFMNLTNEMREAPYEATQGFAFQLYFASILGGMAATTPIILGALSLWPFKPDRTPLFVRTVRLGLAGFAFCGLWFFPQLLYIAYVLHPTPRFDHSQSVSMSSQNRRIVWIVFDELSYNLVFDHPPEGMKFANFQRLRSQSVSFADIEPVGAYTDRILPSLLSGEQIIHIHSQLNGKLKFYDQSQQKWLDYDPGGTLLSLANAAGWNPGVVGWYNPYCRNYASELTTCSWTPATNEFLPVELMGASQKKSALANALIIPSKYFSGTYDQASKTSTEILEINIQEYRDMMSQAQKTLQNEKVHFLLLHMPLPHPPGIYDRTTHSLCTCGNYLDNLELTDDTLGLLLQEIKNGPQADQTTIIISSDHSWRVPLWEKHGDWTPEEERISQGKFDDRPVFLVHFPGETSAEDVATPVPELIEHNIIASMLQDKTKDLESLNAVLHASLASTPQALNP